MINFFHASVSKRLIIKMTIDLLRMLFTSTALSLSSYRAWFSACSKVMTFCCSSLLCSFMVTSSWVTWLEKSQQRHKQKEKETKCLNVCFSETMSARLLKVCLLYQVLGPRNTSNNVALRVEKRSFARYKRLQLCAKCFYNLQQECSYIWQSSSTCNRALLHDWLEDNRIWFTRSSPENKRIFKMKVTL